MRWVKYWDDSYGPVPISRLPEMYAKGFRVWARYVGPGSAGKHWTTAEIKAWRACGPDTGVAFLAEGVGGEAISNPGVGDDHGREALAEMKALGAPAHVLCSPAVDRNINLAETRGPVETYMRNWKIGFGGLPVPYVEMENGGRMVADHVSAATFTPAAYSWNEKPVLITPDNAPSHVVMTQEHNGQNLAGGNVDVGRCRTDAPHVWFFNAEEEDDMADQATLDAIAAAVWHSPQLGPDGSKSASAYMDKLAAIQHDGVTMDVPALATALAPLLNGLTVAQLETALGHVLQGAHLVVTPTS